MHHIETTSPSREFLECWAAAGRHLDRCADGAPHFWIKVDPTPPFLEHLSFRVGNQLFFVRIEDVDGNLSVPGSRDGLRMIADGCCAHACLMSMRRGPDGWTPAAGGWGLQALDRGTIIDPPGLVTDLPVVMTDWELQDFAVQVVRTHIEKAGHRLMSWQGNPVVDPSLWYEGADGPVWVIVRAVRYPERDAAVPANWREIAKGCERIGRIGEFASVAVSSALETFDRNGTTAPKPLLRGGPMYVGFGGLKRLEL